MKKRFSQRAGLMLCFFLWLVADHLLVRKLGSRETEREGGREKESERE